MPKRGENIRKRKDGRWEARYPIGTDCTGKTKYGSVYARTYREVKEKQQERLRVPAPTRSGSRRAELFSEVAELWMENNQLRLKRSTQYRYQNLLKVHIIPDIGSRRIDSITGAEINAYFAQKLQNGRIDKKGGLSPSYVRSIVLLVNAVIAYAAQNGIRQPLQTKLCKPQIQKQELPVLTYNERKQLISFCSTDTSWNAIFLRQFHPVVFNGRKDLFRWFSCLCPVNAEVRCCICYITHTWGGAYKIAEGIGDH